MEKTKSTRLITLTIQEEIALEKIAERSKMDSWFRIRIDKEGNGYANKRDIITLFEGATEYDLETLTQHEAYLITNLLLSFIKK